MDEFIGEPWKIVSYYTDDLKVFLRAYGRRRGKIYYGSCAYIHAVAQWDDLRDDEYNECPKFFDILNEAMRKYEDTYFVQFVFRPDDVGFEYDPDLTLP